MPKLVPYVELNAPNTPKITRQVPFNDEPRFPPGYAGKVPQFMFHNGEYPFGQATYLLQTDPGVAKSANTVFNPIIATKDDQPANSFSHLTNMDGVKQTWGDAKYADPQIPGYAGHVPQRKEFSGSRYAKNCSDARKQFLKIRDHHTSTKAGESSSKHFMPNITPVPLTPLAVPGPRKLRDPPPTDLSVLGDRPITFPVGYAGHIPRLQKRCSASYRPLVYDSVKEFVNDTRHLKALEKRPVQLNRQHMQLHETDRAAHKPIYTAEGEMPSYAGYLPGHIFRSGQTYNESSKTFYNDEKP